MKELNEKWYWRFIKVIYIFFVILAIIGSFAIPIGAIFFEKPIDFLSKDYEKRYEKDGKTYIEKEEYLKILREKYIDFKNYSDYTLIEEAKKQRPDWVIFEKKLELDYIKAIPFCILMIILTGIIYGGILFLIRGITYYIILGKFNPKN